MLKILIIEDNPTIAAQTGEFLAAHQWQIDYAKNAHQGLGLALNNIYDVILLDLNLPDRDGFEVCTSIKNEAQIDTPILMLTARDSFEDKATGFRLGADDYLTKPFDLRELALRCTALSRRSQLHRPKKLDLGELQLDVRTKNAQREGQELNLTSIGYKILELLALAHPEPVSRSYISHHLWADQPPESDALKSHIYALRKALDRPFAHPMLKTVLNVGFKLDVRDEKI